jgi:hypothetical protein
LSPYLVRDYDTSRFQVFMLRCIVKCVVLLDFEKCQTHWGLLTSRRKAFRFSVDFVNINYTDYTSN